jgi:4-alpha-glucanotransferase
VQSAQFQQQLARFRSECTIDYAAQTKARRSVLECLAESFFKGMSRQQTFHQFLRERPEVVDYASFRATCDQTDCGWPAWPERLREGKLHAGDYSEAHKSYHLYVQWVAHEQVALLTGKSRQQGISLYLDLPLGVHPDSYDMWRNRHVFASAANVGAPPDPFFSKGQDWGFAPPDPRRMRDDNSGERFVGNSRIGN